MLDEKQKQQAQARKSRIEGQVRDIQRTLGEERYCMDVLTQTRSIAAALRGVEDRGVAPSDADAHSNRNNNSRGEEHDREHTYC